MSYELPVALSFCKKDTHLAFKNLEWQLELGGGWHEIVLTHDTLTPPDEVAAIEGLARDVYQKVSRFCYPPPRGNWWPPNQAFQETANHMAKQDKSWFWMESDCIPLSEDWLSVLSNRYHKSGKQFFCPQIPEVGHYNGTGVYPVDTPRQIPHAMLDGACAWDVSMRHEMQHKSADAMGTLWHVWCMENGKFHHTGGGESPRFFDRDQLRQIPASCVLFHRDKSGSIIEMLRQCKKEIYEDL